MTKTDKKKPTPERRITELGFGLAKKVFLILVAWVGYWQLYEYISESPEITVVIEKTEKAAKNYKTLISIENGSESVSADDIVRPIKLTFTDSILAINPLNTEVKTEYKLLNKDIIIHFDLINKNEKFQFNILTSKRAQFLSTDCRIKNIKKIKYYDTENKPRPISRILNIWLVLFFLSIIFFVDAILVIIKDIELGDIKVFIKKFPLRPDNIEKFLDGYEAVYKTYRVRVKPDAVFMRQIIANLFISFKHETRQELAFIKHMANLKTEHYILYRTRTAFIMISPIVFLVSLIGSVVNYFYYEFDNLRSLVSLSDLNLILLRTLLVVAILIILFPRRTMTFMFVKKGGHPF
jgi:hypothetical protein